MYFYNLCIFYNQKKFYFYCLKMMLPNVGGGAYIPNNRELEIEIENYIMKTGDVLSGPLHLSILPQQNTELTNKQYVDTQINDLKEKYINDVLVPLMNELKLLKLNDKSLNEKLLKLDKEDKGLEVNTA